jgi:hypothetical protein
VSFVVKEFLTTKGAKGVKEFLNTKRRMKVTFCVFCGKRISNHKRSKRGKRISNQGF